MTIDAAISILIGLLLMIAVGAAIVGYIIWRSDRRVDDAAAEMAREAGE